jgi:tRNA U34 5-methylaminomethyl-2-thiouridine-forming methyltransferase MnmC
VPAKEVSDNFSLVTVASGARSLRSLAHGETFHPVVGPMTEARGLHVAQSRLVERARSHASAEPFIMWDIGLGAAANAVAVLEAFGVAREEPQNAEQPNIELHSFDRTLDPLTFARIHAEELGYLTPWLPALDSLLAEGIATIGALTWRLHLGDFQAIIATPGSLPAPAPHAILYDPYSPAANPGMWTLEHFTRLRAALRDDRPCTLTSYSRSTAVRVTLALAGFQLGRGTATGEKDETTIAATQRSLLAAPIGAEWLGRVARSTRAAPLRENGEPGPISESDLVKLREMFEVWTQI